ncbi:MAG: hypothetical protein LUC23_07615 [Prevotellaceae bacterium]|nr:hypothetical protein [Prevotellaceae bacterium]
MEETIRKTERLIQWMYLCFWLLPLAVVVCGEAGGDWVGSLAEVKRAAYWSQAAVILLTAVCIPLSLKLFSWVLAGKVNTVPLDKALPLYARWCGIRLALLLIPALAGVLSYYLFLNNTGLLCSMMALVASLFCVPGKGRLRRDLHIEKDDNR